MLVVLESGSHDGFAVPLRWNRESSGRKVSGERVLSFATFLCIKDVFHESTHLGTLHTTHTLHTHTCTSHNPTHNTHLKLAPTHNTHFTHTSNSLHTHTSNIPYTHTPHTRALLTHSLRTHLTHTTHTLIYSAMSMLHQVTF